MRTSLKEFKKKALKKSSVEKEYIELTLAYALRKGLIKIRKNAGLTQEELAEILHTNKSNISRLENVNSKISPTISTIEDYANAVGYKLKVTFEPHAVKK